MNLKLKYILIITVQSLVPFALLICGPYLGLHPKNFHGRIIQLVGGALTITLLGAVQYFAGYRREKDVREIFAAIRARGSRTISCGSCDVL